MNGAGLRAVAWVAPLALASVLLAPHGARAEDWIVTVGARFGLVPPYEGAKYDVEPGLFADLWPTDWLRGRVEVRHGFFAYDGYVGDAGIDLIHTGHRWDASIGPRIGYGDANYMDTYFGVTPQEAALSPYIKTPYEPGAGERYLGLESAYSYHISDHWRTIVDFGYHRLVDRAAESPLIAIAGSRNQYSGSFGFSYSFGLHTGKKAQPPS